MSEKKTHREISSPQVNARHLAEYMAGSERAKRQIARNCRYQPLARVVQHHRAKAIVSKAIYEGNVNLAIEENRIRNLLADSDFDRDVLDHNADYVARFALVDSGLDLPKSELIAPSGGVSHIMINGVRVNVEINFRLRRLTRTNKIRVGIGALRYSKGRALSQPIAEWHTAFLHGFYCGTNSEEGAEVEAKLCVVVDAYAGKCYSAPTDARRRFLDMKAACESIAERWDNIAPPKNSVL